MTTSEKVLSLLESHSIDPIRGFLPPEDPVLSLPKAYEAWDNMANNFTAFINAGVIRDQLKKMAVITRPDFQSQSEWERAMLLLSSFAMAYVNSGSQKSSSITPSVAIPLIKVANHLGRVPILTHASVALNNWRKIDSKSPISLDNIATIIQFHGGLDESWFYLVTTMIEKAGASAIPKLLESIILYKNNKIEKANNLLRNAVSVLKEMNKTLRRMYENCEPVIFYKRVRPFLDSFHDIEYQGTDVGKLSFHGGSAAQSSLIQAFDALMGLSYEQEPKTHSYLRKIRKYMPSRHAAFIELIEEKYSFKDCLDLPPQIEASRQKVIEQLILFRTEHLKMVSIYIIKQAKTENQTPTGTGGTNPLKFLKSIRNANQQS